MYWSLLLNKFYYSAHLLREKCSSMKFFLVRIFLCSDWILNKESWKVRTRKISVFGHFSRSDHCQSQMIQTQQTVVLWNWRYTLPVFKNSLNSACCFKKNYGCCSNNSTDRVVITFPLESIVILSISHAFCPLEFTIIVTPSVLSLIII